MLGNMERDADDEDMEKSADLVESKLVTRYEIKVRLESPGVNDRYIFRSIIRHLRDYLSNLDKEYKVLDIDAIITDYGVDGEFKKALMGVGWKEVTRAYIEELSETCKE